jgi:hypothetical protein
METSDFIIKKIENSTYNWHPALNFSLKNNINVYFNVKSHDGGCGSLILYGWNTYNDVSNVSNYSKLLSYLLDIIKDSYKGKTVDSTKGEYNLDVGAVQFVIGQHYYEGSFVEAALDLGFTEVAEYINKRHSNTYKQKLYIWTI